MRLIIYGLMLFFLTACGKNEQVQDKQTREEAATPAPVTAGFYPPTSSTPSPLLGKEEVEGAATSFKFSEKEFKALFNEKSKAGNWHFWIGKLEIAKSIAGTHEFRYRFSDRLELTGQVSDEEKKIYELQSSLRTKEGVDERDLLEKQGIDNILISITNPKLDYKEVNNLQISLVKKVDKWNYPDIKVNNVMYYNQQYSEYLYFTATPG